MWPFKKKPRAPRDPNWEEKAKAEGWESVLWVRDAYDNGWRPGPKAASGWFYSYSGYPLRTPPKPPVGLNPPPDHPKPPPPAAPPPKAP